jgi:hypothetical protein
MVWLIQPETEIVSVLVRTIRALITWPFERACNRTFETVTISNVLLQGF